MTFRRCVVVKASGEGGPRSVVCASDTGTHAAFRWVPPDMEKPTFETLVPTGELLAAWRDGLGSNRAAPEDVLIAVLHQGASFLWREDLPASVVDAALAQRLQGTWAERRDLSPSQWRLVIFGERDPVRRARLLQAFDRVDLEPADWALLAGDPEPQIRAEILWHDIGAAELARLAEDRAPEIRGQICRIRWSDLTGPQRAALLTDSDEVVRGEAERADLRAKPLTTEEWERDGDSGPMLRYRSLAPDLAELLASDEQPDVRRALAVNPGLPPAVIARLAGDPDPEVRLFIACRPELTDEQRDSIAIDFDPNAPWPGPHWIPALFGDGDAMRRLASSNVYLVRRAVARAKRLPPDVVERLANDPDRVVQLFLAESCDDAPADMLLRVAEWWTGSLSAPDVPRRHPNFPKRGLLRFADHPNPNLRRLALDDPLSTADLVERFADDPDRDVRHRAASDPRISVETAERLLSGSDQRGTVAANPGLPPPLLITLLHDERTAFDAARNPALPPDLMREMARRVALTITQGGGR